MAAAWATGVWAADAWAGTAWAAPAATPAATPTPVGGGRGKRRRVIIDDVIYEGTEEQIEAKLWELLDEQRPKPVQTKPVRRRKKAKPVELKETYTPPPIYLDVPRFKQLVTDSYRHEDRFLNSLLKQMMKRWQDEEDDIEAILLLM